MPSTPRTWDTISIIGVGLIGGSIGMAVRERKLAQRVIGIGRRQSSLNKARRCGAIDVASTNLARGVADAELVIVCTPVEQIVEHVRQAASACPAGSLITDAGSTKEGLVNALADPSLPEGVAFVGSHPLAGSEKTGCENGDAKLFENRVCVVTPSRRTKGGDYQAIAGFWQSIGMHVIRMTPSAHDAALAASSHLPHVVAAALATATPKNVLPLVAGGWLDTTRIAAADAKLWRQILLDNRENTLACIDQFQAAFNDLRQAIADNDAARVERLMQKAKDRREEVRD